MTISVTASLLITLLGLALHHLAPGKWGEDGRIMFFAGLLVTLLALGGRQVHLP